MRKFYIVVVVFLFITKLSKAQTTFTWSGGTTGDYQLASNWTPVRSVPASTDILSFNAASPIAVTNTPNQTIGAIAISGTSVVSFATNIPTNVLTLSATVPLIYTNPGSILAADFLTLNLSSAASFTLSSGTFGISPSTGGKILINGAMNIAGGAFSIDVIGTGGTIVNGSVTYTSGTFSCVNTSSLTWATGSNYYHAYNGSGTSAIPVSIWQANSTCNVTGMDAGTTAPTGFASTQLFFANFSWNCAAQTGVVSLLPAGSVLNIMGTLTITNTNNKELRLLSVSGSTTINAAAYSQTGGTVTLQAASLVTDSTSLSITGNFSQTGGILNGVGGSSQGIGIIDVKGNLTKSSAATWQSNSTGASSQAIIQFSGSSVQTVSIAGAWNAPTQGRFNVVNNNSDIVNGVSLTGTLKVINTGSAVLPATLTMRGVITGTGAVAYSGLGAGGTALVYAGSFLQNASGIEYPVSNGPTSLTINNTLGVSFPTSFNRTLTGTLSMITGNLALGSDTLSLTNSSLVGQLTYSGGYITTGTLARTFPNVGLPTDTSNTRSLFPFGTGNNNRSLRIYFSSSSLSAGGSSGIIYVTHSPSIGVPAISPTIADNGVNLDKRTSTNWNITTSGFSLGSGGETIALTVIAGNIGSVDDYTKLRLTDGATGYGTLVNTNTGTNAVCATGKSGLTMSDINKPVYIGSDGTTVYNPLIIITFNWTGLGGNTAWTNPGNWTGINAVGYPSASTEIAIITSTSGTQPTINTSDNINLLQLTVGGGMTLTMVGNAVINVYDNVNFSGGLTSFAPTSTFGYASSSNIQNVLDLPYGGLSVSGTAQKILAPSVTITGNYSVVGYPATVGTGTFTYNYVTGTGNQRIAPTSYYNLTINGNRQGYTISLGTLAPPANTITIAGDFKIFATNYVGKGDFNTIDFISASSQPIPGFIYGTVRNSGNGPRVLDPAGSLNALNVISAVSYVPSTGGSTVTGSKVKFVRSSNTDLFGGASSVYNDLEISGNLTGFRLDFSNSFYISGNFTISATGFYQGTSSSTFIFNGTGDQTLPATFPGFSLNNVNITGTATRKIIFQPSATKSVGISGAFTITPTFVAPNGFVTTGSTVNFTGSPTIPVLVPATGAGTPNYNNVSMTGGTRILTGDMTIGGNVSISGTDASTATLTIGNNASARTLNVLGNVLITGTSALNQPTAQLDLNSNTGFLTTLNLADSLTITGYGQLAGTGSANGTVVFNGALPQVQAYKNNSQIKNGPANFTVGTGTTNTYLSLTSTLDLLRSSTTGKQSTVIVKNNASLDCGTSNITSNGTGNTIFNLNSGSTLITANTGGIEGPATSGTNGSIVNDATIAKTYDDNASYTFNGNTSTPFSTGVPNHNMANLTIGANVNLDNLSRVSNVFTLRSGVNFNPQNSDVILRSTATSTSRVAQVPASASISYGGTGRFNVERYYPAERSWRLVTSPLSSNGTPTTIFDQWQNNGVYTPGIGTFVTGPNPNIGANGLDYSDQNNYSLKTYQNNAYVNIGNTLAPLSNTTLSAANIGYFMFVRGDRSRTPDNTIIPNSNTTTLSSRGKLQYGTQTFPGLTRTAAGDKLFVLVGNPYASPVSFDSLTRNNIAKRFIVWDPKLNTVGGFITFDDADNDGVYTKSSPTPGGQDINIQSGQAIFVETDADMGASSIIFNEASKTTTNNLNMFRPMAPINITPTFRSTLFLANTDGSTILADGNVAQFKDNLSNAVDIQDAIKATNINETFGLMRSNTPIAIERRKTITDDDTLYLYLIKTTKRNYQFVFEPTNLDPLLTAFLEDSYTGIKTPVSVSSATTFDFTVNSDAKSSASNRFKIVFKFTEATPLPVTYSSIKAYQRGADIAVSWTVENEININKYDVEKSTDGENFSKINTTGAKGANSSSATYDFLDLKAAPGNNFYRIVSYNKAGTVEYSRVVLVKIGKTGTGISIYPNPVKGNVIGVAFNNMDAGIYGVRLISTLGQTLLVKQINHSSGSSMETIQAGSQLTTGIYQLEVTSPDKRISTIKVIVQ